jgi:hypothetical protein
MFETPLRPPSLSGCDTWQGSARVVKEGHASQPPTRLAELAAGAVFGEAALLDGECGVRNASIFANGRCVVLRISRDKCRKLLGSSKGVFERAAKRHAEANAKTLGAAPAPAPADASEVPDEGRVKLAELLERIISSAIVSHCVNALVATSTVLMSVPYAGMPAADAAAVELAIDGITCAFAVEMGCKLCVLGCGRYPHP